MNVRGTAGRLAVFAAVLLGAFALFYGAWIAYRTVAVYRQIKSAGRGWEVPVNTGDPKLGYVPLPNVRSFELFSYGYRVPVCQDEHGFRIPCGDSNEAGGAHPIVAAFGCSFTYGTGVRAEDTYPYLVASRLHGTAKNAAVAGYGLAQMLLRARDVIPQQKPDVVLVQYAPWLVTRSMSYTGTWEAHGLTPRPYFARSPQGGIEVAPPAFSTNYFDLDMSSYVSGRARVAEFASFIWRIGIPLWTYADAQQVRFAFEKATHALPPLVPADASLIEFVYSEFAQLCKDEGARMVIVVLNHGGVLPSDMPRETLDVLGGIPGAVVADAYAALYAQLDEPTPEAYEKAYGIWCGTPPVLVDRHPNARAHEVIAETVLEAMGPASARQG